MKYVAPLRAGLDAGCFGLPVFERFQDDRDLLTQAAWPTVAEINARVGPHAHAAIGSRLVFEEPVADQENYERRIARHGRVATRPENWHDLFNALVWKRFPASKSALNAAQVSDMDAVGVLTRTRRQCAMTQFDEAGAVVLLRDAAMLEAWDRHDWECLFMSHSRPWREGGVALHVFGHALLEHALSPHMLLVSKTIVMQHPDPVAVQAAELDHCLAQAVHEGRVLDDPQSLRPLPMPGIPGWHAGVQDADFYRNTPCFRPLRPGRRYPPALDCIAQAMYGGDRG